MKEETTDNKVDPDFRFPEGFLVWAKLKGHCFWPGIITYPDKNRHKNVGPKKSHVHFFGFENQVRCNTGWI